VSAQLKRSVRRFCLVKSLLNFKSPISLIFFTLTLILLGVSLVVHALIYAGFNTRDHFPFVWRSLQYAVVIGFIPQAVRYVSMRVGITSRPPPYIWGSAKYEELPPWKVYGEVFVGVAIGLLSFYAFLSAIYLYDVVLHSWSPYAIDGQYFAYHPRGPKTRTLTFEEYKSMSLYYARAGSGHWMACHLIALAILSGDWKAASNKRSQLTAR
jgi:hypothetical protein